MNYICKIFTPEFKAKVEKVIDEAVKARLQKNQTPDDRKSFIAEFERLEIRSNLSHMWNNPEDMEKYPQIKEYYTELGIWTPEYTEITLKAQEQGLQSRPRVEWNGEIQKIDDIDDIFSFKRAE